MLSGSATGMADLLIRQKTEDRINSFQNFKASLSGEDGEQYDIHFLALVSKKEDAIPIVLLHGWPGRIHSRHGHFDLF